MSKTTDNYWNGTQLHPQEDQLKSTTQLLHWCIFVTWFQSTHELKIFQIAL